VVVNSVNSVSSSILKAVPIARVFAPIVGCESRQS
jgi:hypothetical protein